MLFTWIYGYFYSRGIIFRNLWEFYYYYYIQRYRYCVLLLYIDIGTGNFIPERLFYCGKCWNRYIILYRYYYIQVDIPKFINGVLRISILGVIILTEITKIINGGYYMG